MFKLKLSLLFLPFLLAKFSEAQAPNIQWAKCFGGSGLDRGSSIIQLNDGGFAVAGLTSSPNNGDISGLHNDFGAMEDFWILRLDSLGTLLWQKCLGGSISEGACSIKETFEHGFIITGYATSSDYDLSVGGSHSTNYDYWIVKTDSACNIEWQKCFGGIYMDYAKDIIQTNDSGFVVVGYVESIDGDITSSYGGQDIWAIKYDFSGNLIWKKMFGGSNEDHGLAVREANDGDLIIAGYTKSSDHDVTYIHPGPGDAWGLKLDNNGNLLWQKCYGGTDGEGFSSLAIDHTGNYIFVGGTGSNDGDVSGMHGNGDGWLIKTDTAGQILSQICVGGLNGDNLLSIDITSDNGFILVGTTTSSDSLVIGNNGFMDFYVIKTDSTGSIQWYKCYGGSDVDRPYSVFTTRDGGYAIVGETFSNDGDVSGNHSTSLEFDYWVVKLAPLGLEVKSNASSIDFTFQFKNENNLHLNFYSDISADFTLQLCDITGKIILNEEAKMDAGMNMKRFKTNYLSAGLYFVSVITKQGSVTKKFVVNR